MLKSITIQKWRQFEDINIEFHDRLTILTGANGAGKTTILNLISKHFGWTTNFVGTPQRDNGVLKYFSDIWSFFVDNQDKNHNIIGSLIYSNGQKCDFIVPKEVSYQYDIQFRNQNSVKGIHIPSHRPIYNYRRVESIPTTIQTRTQVYSNYAQEIRNRFYDSYSGRTPNSILKEALISLATFGYGNKVVQANIEALKTFEDFEHILRIVLPPKLGFQKISIEMPEVVLVTNSGNFMLDAVSGGIAAIIDLAWQVFMFDEYGKSFVVTIDEPENHLHPEMQRSILRNFIKAFPNVQFIVATHNPFIITSIPDSNVYVLKYNQNNRVTTSRLDLVNKAGSSNDILRDVLGVPFTMPIWVEEKLDSIVSKYAKIGVSETTLQTLRNEMKEIGMDKYIPDTIVKVIEGDTK